MIVTINGRPVDSWRAKSQSTRAASGTFSWKTVKKEPSAETKSPNNVTNKAKTETLRERFTRYRPALKKNLVPVFSGLNLAAVYPVSAAANTYNVTTAQAAAGGQIWAAPVAASPSLGLALAPIIQMLQELALPVGIGMAIWGLIETMIGNPGGREKIKWALISYVGVFIIPFFFYQIKAAFGTIPMALGVM